MNNSENNVQQNENNTNNNNIELKLNNEIQTNISIPIPNYYDSSNQNEEQSEILLIKVLSELNSNSKNNILNYLSIKELIELSVVNRAMKLILDKYYPIRLIIEYDDIKNFESKNILLKNRYLKQYSIHIPENNWFYSDIKKSINTISNLSRHTISQIRGIKRLPNLDEKIYAPLCLIFNYDSKNEKVINNGWKKTADYIFSDFRFFIQISNLNIENLEYKNIKQAFIDLSEIEKYIDKIKRFSPYLYELNIWCKAVVIYYILVHPYKLNEKIKNKLIKDNEEVFKFVTHMDEIINKFYLFKGFLENRKIFKAKIGEYIFSFEYDKNDNNKKDYSVNKEKEKLKIINDNRIMGNILSYLNIKESVLFINFNKSLFISFQRSLNISCYNLLKKIFIMKYNTFKDLYPLIPSIFENNIFTQYFFMLEDIIYPEYKNISFLSKDNINYIKNYKGNNELINTICKIFCIIFNIKVEKAFDDEYYLIYLYIKSVILFSVKENSLINLIRYFNLFNLNNNQIKSFYEEISKIYNIDKIKKVKSINKGFYQLLLWELYIFEYFKQFNPFLLIGKDTILSQSSQSLNEEQNNAINKYIQYLDNLKKFLKIKYHFQNLFFKKNNNKNFIHIIKDIIDEMKSKKIYNDNIKYIIENYNINQTNVTRAYFHCKKIFTNKNIPSLYQKIMEELILNNFEMINSSKQKTKLNKILKDEYYYINIFSSRKNMKYMNYKSNRDYNNIFKTSRKNYNNNKYKFLKINNNININYDLNSYKNSPKNILSFSHDNFSEKLSKKFNSFSKDKSYISSIINNTYIKNTQTIIDIQDDIFITKILFYLSINDFPKFSLVNKRFYELIKTHIYIRLFFLEKEKNFIEQKHSRIIYIIEEKRSNFYAQNNQQIPNLYHSCILLSSLTQRDIYELRYLFKSYKLQYEIIISILCIFLNLKPNIYIDEYGNKIIDFFTSGKKLLYNKNVINIIKKIDLDNINKDIISKVEKIMENDIFQNIYENTYPPCLINLINFEFGIIEYFRAIRKYYINSFEIKNNILNENEISFCNKMDACLDTYYKIKNYTFNKCQKYHSNSIKLLKQMDLDQNFGNEIKEFENDIKDFSDNNIF